MPKTGVRFVITLRPYQQEAIDSTLRYFQEQEGNPLIVLPTGTGKSVVIADFCKRVLAQWPDTKILVVTHVRELIRQNYEELKGLWPEAPAGINSAGLKKRDYDPSIVFCGIQSVHRKASKFVKVDLVLVDEAHLIPRKTNTMYQKFLNNLKIMNPHVRVIGLTATPYRLDSGLLHSGNDSLFDGVSYEADLKDMVEQGYLTKLMSKQPKTRLDVSGVSVRGGEFVPGELERAVNRADVNESIVREIVLFGAERKSWLIFCAGVQHATDVANIVRRYGVSCETIFGDTPDAERDRIVRDFKAGRIRSIASMGVLTTGFNAPAVDLLALLRPTQSTGLYIQIMGRGMRNSPGKSDCLVLDFAGNIARHGPVDRVNPKKPRQTTGEGVAPTKDCPKCMSIVFAGCSECPDCGYVWPPTAPAIDQTATTLPVMSASAPAEWVKVNSVTYRIHKKPGKPDSMRVEYRAGLEIYREWVCFDHKGYPRDKALKWWRKRMTGPGILPGTTVDAIAKADSLMKPTEIQVRKNGKYTEIVEFRFMPGVQAGGTGVPVSAAAGGTQNQGSLLFNALHG
jgi:DNA repair protein RadD